MANPQTNQTQHKDVRIHRGGWEPHDDPAEGLREIEESNRQASQSQPPKLRNLNQTNQVEPSDSGPEYFGSGPRRPLS